MLSTKLLDELDRRDSIVQRAHCAIANSGIIFAKRFCAAFFSVVDVISFTLNIEAGKLCLNTSVKLWFHDKTAILYATLLLVVVSH